MPDRLADAARVYDAQRHRLRRGRQRRPDRARRPLPQRRSRCTATLPEREPGAITGGERSAASRSRPIAARRLEGRRRRPAAAGADAPRSRATSPTTACASPARLDPYYASVAVHFKAGCPSTWTARRPSVRCLPPGGRRPAIDYLAKDFASFGQALLGLLGQRLSRLGGALRGRPRHDAAGAVAAVGRRPRATCRTGSPPKRTLATATQRRSVVRHARLVDYEPRPATSARGVVQVDVASRRAACGHDGARRARPTAAVSELRARARAGRPGDRGARGRAGRRSTRAGTGALDDAGDSPDRALRLGRQPPLPAGRVGGDVGGAGTGYGFPVSDPQLGTHRHRRCCWTPRRQRPADPPSAAVVHLTGAVEEVDQLFGVAMTRIAWDGREALPPTHDLTRTVLAGNLVPAAEGRRYTETFVIDPRAGLGRRRHGRGHPQPARTAGCGDRRRSYLHTLAEGRLAWLSGGVARGGEPSRASGRRRDDPSGGVPGPAARRRRRPPRTWRWRRSLLDADAVRAGVHRRPGRLPRHPGGRAAAGARVRVRRRRRGLGALRRRRVRRATAGSARPST